LEITRNELLDSIVKEARIAFEGPQLTGLLRAGPRSTTMLVKERFGDLGRHLGCKVAAAGYRHADEGEWLYDMVWYLLENGMMTRQLMVLESEWKHGVLVSQNAEVDGDFQKLVQARAEVRVWISSSHNPALAQQHISNCKKQVESFSGSLSGDAYVFIINDWTTPMALIERFELR
jgi:hypothetical protein